MVSWQLTITTIYLYNTLHRKQKGSESAYKPMASNWLSLYQYLQLQPKLYDMICCMI